MLRKYLRDPTHVLSEEPTELQEDLSYVEKPVKILGRQEKVLRNKRIPLVKVLWRSHAIEEATWELEEEIKKSYPALFGMYPKFRDRNSLRGGDCDIPSL
jgi:''chromo'' (CHRromatin Organisation MOdifier) domain.